MIPSICVADLSKSQQSAVARLEILGQHCGSGFWISKNRLVTAAHVVVCGTTTAITPEGSIRLEVVYVDISDDIAILRPQKARKGHSCLKLGQVSKVGSRIAGYGRFTNGIRLERGVVEESHYDSRAGRATAGVYGGFSGGPVIDRKTNRVVGIVTHGKDCQPMCLYTRVDIIKEALAQCPN